jgi:hypothetical protein
MAFVPPLVGPRTETRMGESRSAVSSHRSVVTNAPEWLPADPDGLAVLSWRRSRPLPVSLA